MAVITDYASLKSAIQVWAVRPDSVFGNQVPIFVEMAEARIYNGADRPGDPLYSPPLRSKVMEASATVSLTDGEGTLPADWLESRSIVRASDTDGMTYMPPERFTTFAANQFGAGSDPLYYTVENSVTIKVTPAVTDTLSLAYYKRFDPITTTNTTNDLIATHGTIYLAACLFEAFSFLQAPDLALGHIARLRSLIMGENRTAAVGRQPGPQRIRVRNPIP